MPKSKKSKADRIPASLVKNLETAEEKEAFRKQWNSVAPITDVIKQVLLDELDRNSKYKKADYDSPSWSHKQAHVNGLAEGIRRALDLLP